jgi:hypothetical protein
VIITYPEPAAPVAGFTAGAAVQFISSSRRGEPPYPVRKEGGRWACPCKGFGYRDRCRHADLAASREGAGTWPGC